MNKISLIIQREYLSRVKKKTFLIMTIVGPLLFAGLAIVPAWLASREKSKTTIAVIDHSGMLGKALKSNEATQFTLLDASAEQATTEKIRNSDEQMLLVIGQTDGKTLPSIRLIGSANPSLDLIQSIENQINSQLKTIQLKESGIDPNLVEKINPSVSIKTSVLSDVGEKEGSSVAATIVGFGSGFLIYIFIFLYGSQVMMGVMEEKTSRVVEILISSVKPFQLMIGKIVGVALVGLTQFLLWVTLSYGIMAVVGLVMNKPQKAESEFAQVMKAPANEEAKQIEKAAKFDLVEEMNRVNVVYILSCFVFYFLGGYLLYSALFAAVGAAVDNQQDAQQFMFPITVPIIFAIVMAQFVMKDPNSPMAFWGSIIPFTSPIIMMIRIPFEPPLWQVLISMACLVAGFFGTTWLAGKIYRVGILMYGKKANYKELWKWIRY